MFWSAATLGAAAPVSAGAQAGPPPDQQVANRALRVAKDIAAPEASDSARAAAYRETMRILDSAEAAGVVSGLTYTALAAAVGYVVEGALRVARAGGSPSARCAAARRARAYADTLQPLLPGADHSLSATRQATLARWRALPDTAASAVRAACR